MLQSLKTMPFRKFATVFCLWGNVGLTVLGGVLRGGSLHTGTAELLTLACLMFYQYFLCACLFFRIQATAGDERRKNLMLIAAPAFLIALVGWRLMTL